MFLEVVLWQISVLIMPCSYLFGSGGCPRAIACDLFPGPLDSAKANHTLQVSTVREIRQGDGLEPLVRRRM